MTTAYIAGFFDGEGSIGVYRYATGRYRASFRLTGAYRPLLVRMAESLPGAVLNYATRKIKQGHKQIYVLTINRPSDIRAALKKLHPYLWEKRAQASVVLDYLAGRITGPCATDMCKKLKRFNFDGEGAWQRDDTNA